MSERTSYVPPKVETLEASQIVAMLGPVSAGSQKGAQGGWGSGGGFPLG